MSVFLELRDVTKMYGLHQALTSVSLTVSSGEVVGLVGDNGSGKSTLVKVMTGYHRPTSGSVIVEGKPVEFSGPGAARSLGIEAVYQDLALVDELSLWRNFFLGRESARRILGIPFIRRRSMRKQCWETLQELGMVHIASPDQAAQSMSGGEKQSLSITRAVHFGARLLILDEPTAALSVRETERVLGVIDEARTRGLGVILIDHNMDHVAPVADRVYLLEHGRIAGEFKSGDISADELRSLVRGSTDPGRSA